MYSSETASTVAQVQNQYGVSKAHVQIKSIPTKAGAHVTKGSEGCPKTLSANRGLKRHENRVLLGEAVPKSQKKYKHVAPTSKPESKSIPSYVVGSTDAQDTLSQLTDDDKVRILSTHL